MKFVSWVGKRLLFLLILFFIFSEISVDAQQSYTRRRKNRRKNRKPKPVAIPTLDPLQAQVHDTLKTDNKLSYSGNKVNTGAWNKNSGNREELWVKQKSIADAIGADIIGNVQLPIHVNVLPIGLDGSGHLGLNIPSGMIESWMLSLEKPLPHLMTDTWEYLYGKSSPHKDYSANIEYTVTSQVISTDSSVSDAFNRMLHAHHRVVEPLVGPGDEVLDAFGDKSKVLSTHLVMDGNTVSDAVSDLSKNINAPRGYTMALMNPKREWLVRSLKTLDLFDSAMQKSVLNPDNIDSNSNTDPNADYPPYYGYINGFTDAELEFLMHDADVADWVDSVGDVYGDEVDFLEKRFNNEYQEINDELRFKRKIANTQSKRNIIHPDAWEAIPARYRIDARTRSTLKQQKSENQKKSQNNPDTDFGVIGLPKDQLLADTADSMADIEHEVRADRHRNRNRRTNGPSFTKPLSSLLSSHTTSRATLTGQLRPLYRDKHTQASSSSWAEEMMTLFPYDTLSPGKSFHGVARLFQRTQPMSIVDALTNRQIQETCLSDVWVGSDRVAFIDYAAGPFKWGPIVGGEGVRAYHSLPNVDDLADLSVTSGADKFESGGMKFYDYVKGTNRKALEQEVEKFEQFEREEEEKKRKEELERKEAEKAEKMEKMENEKKSETKANNFDSAPIPKHRQARKPKRANINLDTSSKSKQDDRKTKSSSEQNIPESSKKPNSTVKPVNSEEWGIDDKDKDRESSRPSLNRRPRNSFGVGRRPMAVDVDVNGQINYVEITQGSENDSVDYTYNQDDGVDVGVGVGVDGEYDIGILDLLRKAMKNPQATIAAMTDHSDIGVGVDVGVDGARSLLGVTGEGEDNYDDYFSKEELEVLKSMKADLKNRKSNTNSGKPQNRGIDPRFKDYDPTIDYSKQNKPPKATVSKEDMEHELELKRQARAEADSIAKERGIGGDGDLFNMENIFADDLMNTAMRYLKENEAKNKGQTGDKKSEILRESDKRSIQNNHDFEQLLRQVENAVKSDVNTVNKEIKNSESKSNVSYHDLEDDDDDEDDLENLFNNDDSLSDILAKLEDYDGGDYDNLSEDAKKSGKNKKSGKSKVDGREMSEEEIISNEDRLVKQFREELNRLQFEEDTASLHTDSDSNSFEGDYSDDDYEYVDEDGNVVADPSAIEGLRTYSPGQLKTEISMIEQLLTSNACIVGALDCTDYKQELEALKKLLSQVDKQDDKAKTDKPSLTEEEEDDEDDDDEDEGNRKLDGGKDGRMKITGSTSTAYKPDWDINEELSRFAKDNLDLFDDFDDDDDEDGEKGARSEEALRLYEELLRKEQQREEKERAARHKKLLNVVPHGVDGSSVSWMNEAAMLNHFLSHTSHAISNYLRHVVVPPVANPHRAKLYHRRVAFTLYVARDHNNYDPLEDDIFRRMQVILEQTRVKGQQFSFQIIELSLASDPALALAYASSLRASVVPTMKADGKLSSVKRLYIDSKTLHHELSSRLLHKTGAPLSRGTREIPIFLFSLRSELPVLIDKHYQAQAMPDMVIAVQSHRRSWESPLSCSGKAIHVNLRHPLKPMVQSTLQLLGGLLPAHVSYDVHRRKESQNWMWSVGDDMNNALCSNDNSITLSKHTIDTIHRNYLVHAIRTATSVVNQAVEQLSEIKPSTANMEILQLTYTDKTKDNRGRHVKAWEGKKMYKLMRKAHRSVRYRIHKMRKIIHRIDYSAGVRQIRDTINTAYQFAFLADTLIKHTRNLDCLSSGSIGGINSGPAIVERVNRKQGAEKIDTQAYSKSSREIVDNKSGFLSIWLWGAFVVVCFLFVAIRKLNPPSPTFKRRM